MSEIDICIICGETPCCPISQEEYYARKGCEYRAITGKSNNEIRHYLYKTVTYDMYSPLGVRNYVPLPKCLENHIKLTFPNKDSSLFVGFHEADYEVSD